MGERIKGSTRDRDKRKTKSLHFGLAAHSLDSSLIRTPVVKMISVIYIIEPIVSCCAAAASYLFFSLAKSLPVNYVGEPQGSIVHFDVVSF